MINSQAEMVRNFVNNKVQDLISDPVKNQQSYGILARGVGKHPGNVPDVWEFTLKAAPQEFYGETGDPTCAEWAVHIALTLLGLHNYGKTIPMHKSDITLGAAAASLAEQEEGMEKTVKMRFDAIVISEGPENMTANLRWLIKMLREKDIPLDYAQLAENLFNFQDPELSKDVRLGWSMAYYEGRSSGNG